MNNNNGKSFITLDEIENEIQDMRLAEKMLYRTKYNEKKGADALEHIRSCINAMSWLEECCLINTKKREKIPRSQSE